MTFSVLGAGVNENCICADLLTQHYVGNHGMASFRYALCAGSAYISWNAWVKVLCPIDYYY